MDFDGVAHSLCQQLLRKWRRSPPAEGLPLFMVLLALSGALLFSCAGGAQTAPAPGYQTRAAVSAEAASTSASAVADAAAESRMIAYTISATVQVKNPDESRERLLAGIESQGGFLVQESYRYITARIPAGAVDTFMESLKTLGTVSDLRKSGSDITDQYRDDAIRLESLKTVRDRYLALLTKAANVTEILGIERELERVNTEIEVLEGRKRAAEQRVSHSLVIIYLSEKVRPGPLGWIFYGLYQGIKWLFVW
jgi:hypothetical protein